MAASGRVKAWRDLFEKNIAVPVAYDRQHGQSTISTPFNLTIKNIEGIIPRGEKGKTSTEYQLRLSLFDLTYKQFFGRTWTGPTHSAKATATKSRLTYNQNIYFHTSLNDASIVLVAEIVAVTHTGAGKMQQIGCGWGFLPVFKYEGDMLDTSSASPSPTNRMDIYHGSPRALLFLDEPLDGNPHLTLVNGCQVMYSLRTHRYMQKVMHLLPENVLIGTNDCVPGLSEGKRESKTAVPDSLSKPRLLRALPCFIERISVNVNPSIEKFEEELVKQLNDDKNKRENITENQTPLQIMKRYVQIGVHNGWCYVHDPEIAHLVADSSQPGFKRTGSFKRGHQRSSSTGSINSSTSNLVHKNRIELEGMVEDPSFAVVFTLIYELGEPTKLKDRRARPSGMSIAHAAFTVSVRWAAWCPLTNLNQPEHSLQLLGGPSLNPDATFIFVGQGGEQIGSSTSLASVSGGTLNFSFSTLKQSKENFAESARSLTVPGQQFARPPSQTSLHTEVSSVLNEVQVTGRPPLPSSPCSPRGSYYGSPSMDHSHSQSKSKAGLPEEEPGTAGSMGYDAQGHPVVPPLVGLGTSPPQTAAYMSGGPMYQGGGYQGALTPHGVPYGTTPRGYVPVEIQHYRESQSPQQSSRAAIMSPDLQELPFTPVHAPIMATAPGMHSGQGLSRAAYAKLYTAGFPPILDRSGEAADVVDPADIINYIAAKEQADRLQTNEVILQFLAFSRMITFDSGATPKSPSNIFFTFQFYRFPQVTSERLLLGNVEGELSADPNSLPCVLQRLDKDGSVLKGPPGYQVKYHMDPAYLKPGEGRLFVQHLANQTLHLDVWDGDSLLLIGSCSVELKHLCRQGREAVQVTYELDVMSTEYIEHELLPSGDLTRDGSVRPAEVNTVLRGRLHLRMANIGYPADKLVKSDYIPQPEKTKTIVTGGNGTSFLGGSLNAVASHTKTLGSAKVCKAQHVAETNHELASVLHARREKNLTEDTGTKEGNAERRKKMARMEVLRSKMGPEGNPLIMSFRKEKEDRSRDLKTIELYRSQGKRDGILDMLSQAISTEHTVHPSLGTTEFFEFVLKNPYNVEHTIIVECNDPELFVITDPREWRHFKMLREVYTSVEEGMFNTETKSGRPEIFLRPKESVNVPFKFLTFKADHSVSPQAPSDPFKPQTQRNTFQKKKEDPLQSRVIKVYFKTEENKPVAILSLKVEPQPHIVDQTFRFHHPEQSFLKKSIRLPPLHTLPGVPVGGPGLNQVFVKCSDPNIICESKKVAPGEPHDVFLKVACGASPQIKKFFLSIYADAFLSHPLQIWQFYVHAMQRVDVACDEGQTSRLTLILRGTQASRLVQVFSSHVNEMQLHPKDPFMLAANTLQELHVGVRPNTTGCKFLYINVVDIEYHQLIRSWLVCVTCRSPVISKAFELLLPVGGGKGCNKRISFTNPYPSKKVFYVRTNREDLLQFKESRIELGAGETTNLGLRFAPSMSPGSIEFLVFINNEDDKNEETFCVKAVYQ